MKTTIHLPDDLALRAKRFVADIRRATTLRELMVVGLERELDRREQHIPVDFAWVTVAGNGLQIETREVIATAYGMPS